MCLLLSFNNKYVRMNNALDTPKRSKEHLKIKRYDITKVDIWIIQIKTGTK